MKKILYILFIISSSFTLSAQTSLLPILEEIELNNKGLKAAQQNAVVQRIDAKTGIYPSDLSVEFEHMFGNKVTDYKRESELTVVQELDFPTAYFQKNKIANMQQKQADIRYRIARQDILLEAKKLCVELVYFNKMKNILKQRMENTETLNISYQKRIEIGDANILETNKIALEYLNVETEYRLNEVEIKNRLEKLAELNGGKEILFKDTIHYEYPSLNLEQMLSIALDFNPELIRLKQEKEISNKSVALAKSMALPKINIGYKMNISNPEKFHGFVAGISIPLWENKNTVKKAKAESILADMEIEKLWLAQMSELGQLYDRITTLKKSVDEYNNLLSTQNNNQLLFKALSLGQISLLEYLTEVNFLYQSLENSLQTERDYYLTLADFFKIQL